MRYNVLQSSAATLSVNCFINVRIFLASLRARALSKTAFSDKILFSDIRCLL